MNIRFYQIMLLVVFCLSFLSPIKLQAYCQFEGCSASSNLDEAPLTLQEAQQIELGWQRLVQKITSNIENIEEVPGLVTDMENILRPHSDLLFNTIPQMQTDPEFEPYIKRYEALKAQYTGIHTSISTKVFLSASPLPVKDYESSLKKSAFCVLPLDIIIVDRDTWEHYQDEVRQFILFHELGHCDLDQGHNSNHIMDTS